MTTLELHQLQTIEREFDCKPNLITGFVTTMFPKKVSISLVCLEIKRNLNPIDSIIAQLFKIREKFLIA